MADDDVPPLELIDGDGEGSADADARAERPSAAALARGDASAARDTRNNGDGDSGSDDSDDDDDDDDDDQNWDDWVDDGEHASQDGIAKCLFCDVRATVDTAAADGKDDVWVHMRNAHQGFVLREAVAALGLDIYGTVRLVNYIRCQTTTTPTYTYTHTPDLATTLADDTWLKPVLPDDPIIMAALGEVDDDPAPAPAPARARAPGGSSTAAAADPPTASTTTTDDIPTLLARLDAAERRAAALEAAHAEYRSMVHRTLLEDEPGAGPGGKGSKAKAKGKVGEKGDTKGREGDDSGDEEEEGASYFDSYAHIDIHETMLKDKVRTEAYRDFIYLNKHLFAGKTVLDVGCGTGILSMFCARAGAARVYAVDNSDIVDKAREIVKLNGLQDVVTVLRGKIESTPLPTPVDIIVSEWMGYCLLFEAMLDSVLVAREAHLRKGGILAPGGCEMHAALWSDPEWIDEHVGYFGDVYGFAMEPLKEEFYKEGQVEVLAKDSIVSDLVLLKTWDIAACTVPSLDFTSTVTLQVTRRDVSKIYGIAVSFDVTFSGPSPDDHNVRMTTSPLSTPTHWKQGLLLLREPIVLDKDGPSEVTVQLSVCKGVENKRELEISAQVSVPRKSAVVQKWFVR